MKQEYLLRNLNYALHVLQVDQVEELTFILEIYLDLPPV